MPSRLWDSKRKTQTCSPALYQFAGFACKTRELSSAENCCCCRLRLDRSFRPPFRSRAFMKYVDSCSSSSACEKRAVVTFLFMASNKKQSNTHDASEINKKITSFAAISLAHLCRRRDNFYIHLLLSTSNIISLWYNWKLIVIHVSFTDICNLLQRLHFCLSIQRVSVQCLLQYHDQ